MAPVSAEQRSDECSIPGVDASHPGPFVDVRLVSIDPSSGATRWTAHLGSSFVREWALMDGALYASIKAGPLLSMDPADCSVNWSREQGLGAVGFAFDAGTLYAVDEISVTAVSRDDGSVLWQFDIPKAAQARLLPDGVTAGAGAILIPIAGSNRVVGIDPAVGTEIFRTPGSAETLHGVIAVGDRVFIAIGDRVESRSSSDGSLEWSTPLQKPLLGPPAVVEGVVAVASADTVVGLDAIGGSVLWASELESQGKVGPIAGDGAFHLLDTSGRHLAFDPADGSRSARPQHPACCISADLEGGVIVVNRGGSTATFDLAGAALWTSATGADGAGRLAAVRTEGEAVVMVLWTLNGAV